MNRKLIALLLSLGLFVTPLAACGGDAREVEDCDREDFEEGDSDCEGVSEDDVIEAEEDEDGGFKLKKSKKRR